MAFLERHRRLLNAYVAAHPASLDGALAPLLATPRLLDLHNKARHFRARMRALQAAGRRSGAGVAITVNRRSTFEDSFRQLKGRSAAEMRGPLNVRFRGEEGIDAGGVTREWYEVMAREICDPNLALFTSVPEHAQTFQPSPSAVIQSDGGVSFREYFRFAGRFVGKALADGQQLACYFTRSFYKHMLDVPLALADLEAVDPAYHKNLQVLLDNDVDDVCPDTRFVIESSFFGRTDAVELKPGGASIPLTNANAREFADLAARHTMTTAIRDAVVAFQAGLWEMVPLATLRVFSHAELELMISGLPDIDVADLRRSAAYGGGLAAGDRLAVWFWQVAEELPKQDVALLVQFVTGSSKVPLGGFGSLTGIAGPQRFSIHRAAGASAARLPTAHTCFNQLDLPPYDCKEQLRERLVMAIHEGATGFGFA